MPNPSRRPSSSCSASAPRPTSTLLLLGFCAAALLHVVGCSTAAPQDTWPQVDVLPKSVPADLDREASTSVLRRGPGGLLYIVGGVDEGVSVGDTFLARYSGEWPIEDLPRPPLAAGQIARVYEAEGVALVQLLYAMPDTELDQLEITWQDDIAREDLGKGVARVGQVYGEEQFPDSVELSIGQNLGVQPGDIYALFNELPEDAQAEALHLGRRLSSICLVQSVTDARARCQLWHGSRLHPVPPPPEEGNTALFLEHTFGTAPQQALVQFASIQGDEDNAIRAHLIEQMQHYLNTHAAVNVTVEALDLTLDPSSPRFYDAEGQIDYRGMPQIVVGAAMTARGKKKREHLIFNYLGVGPPAGPGMIAASPERGMDLGRADKIKGSDLRQLFGVILSRVFIYRGQTSESLMHLRQMLEDENLQGEMRWHMRDQYAMRWAALDYLGEALWLVLEDERVGQEREDSEAAINALGTRVRLLEMSGATSEAVAEAKRYMELREQADEGATQRAAAVSMYAEMLLSADEIDLARAQIARLQTLCGEDACGGDLFSYLSNIYWSIPPSASALQQRTLASLSSLSSTPSDAARLMLYRGTQSMSEGEFAQALLTLGEAERLFSELNYKPNVMRTKYFVFLAQLGMEEPIKAYETAGEAIAIAQEVRDYQSAARIYDPMLNIYFSLDMEQAPGAYIKLASRVLNSVYDAQVARGALGQSSETLFTIGTLFFRLGAFDDADVVLHKAVVYAIRATRFDIAAMGHLTLAMIARVQGDMESFGLELSRAQTMAEISGDPSVIEAIDRALEPPPQEPEAAPPVDTQLL